MRLCPVETGHNPPRFAVGDVVEFYDNHTDRYYRRGRIIEIEAFKFDSLTKYRYHIWRFAGLDRFNIRQTNILYIDVNGLLEL